MDHVPLPHNPAGPKLRVPYLAVDDYDDGPLSGYPARQGWSVRQSRNGVDFARLGETPSPAFIASFLQTWLYFGLLRNTVGPNYRDVSFRHKDTDGRAWLSTLHLQQLIGPWSQDLLLVDSVQDLQPLKLRLKQAAAAIAEVRGHASHIGLYAPEVLGAEVLLSIAILAETLMQALQDVCTVDAVGELMRDDKIVYQRWRMASDTGRFDPARPLVDYMKERGWCRSDTFRFARTMDHVGTLYYVSHLTPPREYANHKNCTDDLCMALKIEPDSYQLSHTTAGCNCGLLRADLRELAGVIEAGRLPVFDVTRSESGEVVLSVHAVGPEEQFVSVSHVWAEGLGNPYDNALHVCQLQHLSNLTTLLSTDGSALPLWVDTICVPVRPFELQQLAISRLRDPYRLASVVLVLDNYLRNIRKDDINGAEVFARILCSSWMQRLWTLQEGRLGRNVYFQFADRPVNLREEFNRMEFRRIPSVVYRDVQLDLIFSYEATRFTDKLADHNGNIISTRRALKTRSVSVPSDEALCVGCLMGLELDDIVAAPGGERMAAFWRKLDRIPMGIVFSKARKKLNEPGLHWAPKSFLGSTPTMGGEEDSWYGPNHCGGLAPAIRRENGLFAHLSGIKLHPQLHTISSRCGPDLDPNKKWSANGPLYLRDQDGRWYLLSPSVPWSDGRSGAIGEGQQDVILSQPLPDVQYDPRPRTEVSTSEREFGVRSIIAGVMASAERHSNAVLHVRGRTHVSISRFERDYERCLEIARTVALEMLGNRAWWLLSDEIEQECCSRAAVMMEADDELRSLYKAWHAWQGYSSQPASSLFGSTVAAFGAFHDLLAFEAPQHEQQWCVD